MEPIECSYPDCHCGMGLVQTYLGYLCGIHVQEALDICRGEQRLIEAEEQIKAKDKRIAELEAALGRVNYEMGNAALSGKEGGM